MKPSTTARNALVASVAALVALAPAHADSAGMLRRDTPSAYLQECASCHVGFPPGMLPARSWQRVTSGLAKHYGSDASLDAALEQQIGDWLQKHAGTYKRVREEPPQDRITRSEWFERKHRKLAPSVWADPRVKSRANCAACHPGAEQGNYDEDELRLPQGLDARQRRAWFD